MKSESVDRIASGLRACAQAGGGGGAIDGVLLKAVAGSVPMRWLQPSPNPMTARNSSGLKSSEMSTTAELLSKYYVGPEECLQFFVDGFDELLKCRVVSAQ
jgi:hypothetical protein